MRSLRRKPGIAIAAMLFGIACGSQRQGAAEAQLGGVAVNALTARADVTGVSLSLTRLDGGWSNTFTLRNSRADKTGTWSGLFQEIPVGRYGVYAKATDGTGNVLFDYTSDVSSPVVVSADVTASITVLLQEKQPKKPFANGAPYFLSLLASRAAVASSTTVQLSAVAADPDGDALRFTWTSGTGSALSGQTDTATTSAVSFQAVDGDYAVTVKATDPAGASAVVAITIHVSSSNATGGVVAIVDMNNFPAVTSVTSPNAQADGSVGARADSPIKLTATATDLDGDALGFLWSAGKDDAGNTCGTFAGQADAAGRSDVLFVVTTSQSWGGSCPVTVTVQDGRGGTNTGTLQVALKAPMIAGGPQFYVTALSPVFLEPRQQAEVKVVPADGSASWSWTYAWSDGLQAPFQGAFAASGGDADQLYTPASCDALGLGDHAVMLAVTVTDSQTGLRNRDVLPVTVHCPSTAWKFGVMSDTQWPSSPDGKNPNSVAVNVIEHLNEQFIGAGVKFVVAVGDVTDNGSKLALDTRATFAQALYDAGVGFYPLRGNHESSAAGATEFQRIFPQNRDGVNNKTPVDALVATTAYGPPPAVTTQPFTVGSNFASLTGFEGLTYAFDYGNVRFVLYDQFTPPAGTPSHSVMTSADAAWIGVQVAAKPAGGHAFVFGHKGFITENHADTLFGSDPSANPTLQSKLMASLASAGVRYYMGGHDHMHNRAIVASPDGASAIQNIITASDSYKFYVPQNPSNDAKYDIPSKGITNGPRETMIAQELFTVGYYVVTVDGLTVTVDYFASPNGCSGDCDETFDVIPYVFSRHETFGYGLAGKEYLVPQGASYSVIDETFQGTRAKVLAGVNGATDTDYAARKLTKAVDTGWTRPSLESASAILTIWGMASVTNWDTTKPLQPADPYALSMTYDPSKVTAAQLASGHFGLAKRTASGAWVNAAGATATFVNGPWSSSYAMGTYGVDTATSTVWAVIDTAGDFAAAAF